jgi:hypothetical protein
MVAPPRGLADKAELNERRRNKNGHKGIAVQLGNVRQTQFLIGL